LGKQTKKGKKSKGINNYYYNYYFEIIIIFGKGKGYLT